MTIDEAIEHAKEVARTCDDDKCIAEHIQLAEWLRQARGADKAARWYTEKIRKLEAENAKLQEENAELRKLAQEACEMTGNLLDDLSDLDKELGIEVDK